MDRRLIRNFLVLLFALYPLGIAGLSVLKLNVPLCSEIPWPEVFYGPVITLASTFVMFLTIHWIVSGIHRWMADVNSHHHPESESGRKM